MKAGCSPPIPPHTVIHPDPKLKVENDPKENSDFSDKCIGLFLKYSRDALGSASLYATSLNGKQKWKNVITLTIRFHLSLIQSRPEMRPWRPCNCHSKRPD